MESKVVFFKGGAVVLALVDVTLAPPRKAASGTPPLMLSMRVSTVPDLRKQSTDGSSS